jgi:hypothetical protein
MLFDQFAKAMMLAGLASGLGAAALVPTQLQAPERTYRSASTEDYPEITATSYESYPVSVIPTHRRRPLRLAAWESQWRDDPAPRIPPPEPHDADYGFGDDGSYHEDPLPLVPEDEENGEVIQLSLTDLP